MAERSHELPADVATIIDYVKAASQGYGYMKWDAEAKLKADMMNVRRRWSGSRVTLPALRAKCVEVGLRQEDTATILDMVRKVQAGRRLVPPRGYRDFEFQPPPPDEAGDDDPGNCVSRDW